MDLRHLRYFVVLAEQRHFGRAAELLNMAQPPLSQQIKALEDELEVTLFDRSTRPIELTAAGRTLLREARQILHHVSRAQAATRRAGQGQDGHLVIGVTGSAAMEFLPPVLLAFRARWPDIRLSLREMSSPEQIAALERGEIHIGFVRPPVLDDRLNVRLVHQDPFVVALPGDHPQAGVEGVRLADLNGTALIIFDPAEAPGFRDLIIHVCRTAGYVPETLESAPQMTTMLALVSAGLGFALVPRSARRLALERVVFRPLLDPCAAVELYAVWSRDKAVRLAEELVSVIDEARYAAPGPSVPADEGR
ncbi:LysR family transcriptional regulator [Methylobacterium nodulans]|uniref:Transcriptional regulator, LysR family n=1 Tax=Methylobacterium nodulans (strain LMG 21967 / CNCM I-2342 / ORS 2060) TaxID=460265 RepID=B8IJK2_METNO|nr:LysR family transcriptional regulator [Methylobacterium nodulans]ACL58050.1 transcriptional regulator, LysR family [Methylobacterium nodulans ORS 2060]